MSYNTASYGTYQTPYYGSGSPVLIKNDREVKDRSTAKKIQEAQQNQRLPQFVPQPQVNPYGTQTVIHHHIHHNVVGGEINQRADNAGRGAMSQSYNQPQPQMPAVYSKPFSSSNPNPHRVNY